MGKGICPIIGSLLPLSNIDLPEKTIEELVFKRNIRVYDVRTRVMITSRNYKDMFVKNNTFEANTKSNNSVSKEEKIEVIKTIETPVTFTEVKESENVIDEPMTGIEAELSTEENIVENTNPYIITVEKSVENFLKYFNYWIHDTNNPIKDNYLIR